MDRSHLEDALAVGQLEIRDLQDNGERLAEVHDTDQHENQRHIQRKRHAADHAAEEQ